MIFVWCIELINFIFFNNFLDPFRNGNWTSLEPNHLNLNYYGYE